MSHAAPDLSRVELLLLARLSGSKKPPSENDIAQGFAKLVVPAESPGTWRERIVLLLSGLRERALIDTRRHLTDAGKAALRQALGAPKVPTWKEARNRFLPGLALGGDGAAKLAADSKKLPV